ncbi:hypothetical protein AOLI_G00188380 [Acnodon oligacanthus]
MDIFLQAFFLCLVTCTGSQYAQSRIYVTVKAGSSAVLPCDWRNKTQSSGERPHIEWRTLTETVFERRGGDQYQGEGYERRVDVPEDKLLGGDCSLVLKDVRLTDSGPYESYLLEKRTKRSLRSKRVFIQAVELSVDDSTKMMIKKLFRQLSLIWTIICTVSAKPQINISAQVGSSVLLPCDFSSNLSSVPEPHIRWYNYSEVVFERAGEESFPGEGYEGRMDVPEDKLSHGDGSLVLKDVRHADENIYECYLVMKAGPQNKWAFIQRVSLSVEGKMFCLEEQISEAVLMLGCTVMDRLVPKTALHINKRW